jgi:hypothetical protein
MVPRDIVYLVSSGRTREDGSATSMSWIADELCRAQVMGSRKGLLARIGCPARYSIPESEKKSRGIRLFTPGRRIGGIYFMRTRILSLVVGAGFASLVHGAIIYSDFGPGQSFDTGFNVAIGTYPGLVSQEAVAASFTPSASWVLTAIDFAAGYDHGPNQLDVYLTSGAVPGAPIESFSFTNLTGVASVFTATSVAQPTLLAGTTYWVVLAANDPVNSGFFWSFNVTGVHGVSLNLAGGPWQSLPSALTTAFDVQGTAIPEPATFSLLGASVLFGTLRKYRVRVKKIV